MAYFDLIYVSVERGREEEALARLEPFVAELYGTHHVRTRRGSGWVQLQREDDPLERLEFEEIHPEGPGRCWVASCGPLRIGPHCPRYCWQSSAG